MNYIHKLFLHITVFQGIVEFIYHGEVSVFQESLTSFLRTAQILKVKGNLSMISKPFITIDFYLQLNLMPSDEHSFCLRIN